MTTPRRTFARRVAELLGLGLVTVGIIVVATPHSDAAVPATSQVVLRPVTATGHARPGWHVVIDNRPAISCDGQSPWSVSGAVDFCGSTADNTLACWRSATAHRVLCVSDVWSHTLRSIRLDGAFAVHRAAAHPQPVGLTLVGHTRFLARAGGAWSAVRQHPSWVGWYYERGAGGHTIYGPPSSGIDRSHATWTVTQYGDVDEPGRRVAVGTAYLLGTAA